MAPAPGLGALLALLALPRGSGGQPKVLHSLHYLNVAVMEPSLGIPQFMDLGHLDGIPITRYDSERHWEKPLTPWMAAGTEPEYWDEETQISERNRIVAAASLERVGARYNWSGGLHTWQRLSGCDLLSDGSVRRTLRLGYDGRDFISFSLESGTFVVANGAAQITQRKWRSEGYKDLQQDLGLRCAGWLQKYVGYGWEALEHKGKREDMTPHPPVSTSSVGGSRSSLQGCQDVSRDSRGESGHNGWSRIGMGLQLRAGLQSGSSGIVGWDQGWILEWYWGGMDGAESGGNPEQLLLSMGSPAGSIPWDGNRDMETPSPTLIPAGITA